MKSILKLLGRWSGTAALCAIAVSVNAQTPTAFKSPDDAVKELIAAVRSNDRTALDAMLAPDARRLLSGDEVQEAQERARFVAMADEKTEVIRVDDAKYSVEFGNDGWSFPVPIVKRGEQWAFDSSEGMNELLLRRVGSNELATMLVCAAYAVAQWDYFLEGDWNGDGVQEFAQKLVSSPGQKDGLYWPSSPAEDSSPLGPLVAYAHAEGYGSKGAANTGNRAPFHGYHFKVLKAQGPNAPGGRYNYLINGRMLAGFGLVAYPATYGSSGVMTFIVNQQGKVYQKNLGPNTAKIAQAMSVYNPDSTWEMVDYESALLKLP